MPGPKRAQILGDALAEQLVVPGGDFGEPAPGIHLLVEGAGRHDRREPGLVLPLAERLGVEQLDRHVAARRLRAGRARVVVVGQALTGLPAHAGLLTVVLDGLVHGREQLVLVRLALEAGADELVVLAALVEAVGEAELEHGLVGGNEDLAAAEAGEAAELAGLLEHHAGGALVVRDDRRAEAAEARADRDDVRLEIPARRRSRHARPSYRSARAPRRRFTRERTADNAFRP